MQSALRVSKIEVYFKDSTMFYITLLKIRVLKDIIYCKVNNRMEFFCFLSSHLFYLVILKAIVVLFIHQSVTMVLIFSRRTNTKP